MASRLLAHRLTVTPEEPMPSPRTAAETPRAISTPGKSQRQIARELGVSRTRVQQHIRAERTASEALHEAFLASASTGYLRRHERALVARIRIELAQLRATREELASRRVDELIGVE